MLPLSDTALMAHHLADVRSDAGDDEAAKLLNACGGELSALADFIHRLAYAATESNKRKRLAALELIRTEMEAQGISTSMLPMRSPERRRPYELKARVKIDTET